MVQQWATPLSCKKVKLGRPGWRSGLKLLIRVRPFLRKEGTASCLCRAYCVCFVFLAFVFLAGSLRRAS
jgi:hypothetical protein